MHVLKYWPLRDLIPQLFLKIPENISALCFIKKQWIRYGSFTLFIIITSDSAKSPDRSSSSLLSGSCSPLWPLLCLTITHRYGRGTYSELSMIVNGATEFLLRISSQLQRCGVAYPPAKRDGIGSWG